MNSTVLKKTLTKVDNEKIKITFNYTDIRDLKNMVFLSVLEDGTDSGFN